MSKIPEKLYYKIGEVSGFFKVNPSLIRHWEKEFPFLTPKKNSKGSRRYNQEDIQKIQVIHTLLKKKGLTIAGANKYLNDYSKKEMNKMGVINRLQKIKNELLKIKNQLD